MTEAGKPWPSSGKAIPAPKKSEKGHQPETPKPSESLAEERIAVTVRLPKELAHALMDASAERRKNREENWSQQAIVGNTLERWLSDRIRKQKG